MSPRPAVTARRGAGAGAPLVPYVRASRRPQPSGESGQGWPGRCEKPEDIDKLAKWLLYPEESPLESWDLGTFWEQGGDLLLSAGTSVNPRVL